MNRRDARDLKIGETYTWCEFTDYCADEGQGSDFKHVLEDTDENGEGCIYFLFYDDDGGYLGDDALVTFKVKEVAEDFLDTKVEVTDIYIV